MTITLTELKKVANEFLKENFNMKLKIPILINKRISRTAARFVYSDNIYFRESKRIEISDKILNDEYDDVIGAFKHELVHYALFELNLPSRDSDKYFQDTLIKLNLPKIYKPKNYQRNYHLYICECSKSSLNNNLDYNECYRTENKFRKIWLCSKCKMPFEYVGKFKCKLENNEIVDIVDM